MRARTSGFRCWTRRNRSNFWSRSIVCSRACGNRDDHWRCVAAYPKQRRLSYRQCAPDGLRERDKLFLAQHMGRGWDVIVVGIVGILERLTCEATTGSVAWNDMQVDL